MHNYGLKICIYITVHISGLIFSIHTPYAPTRFLWVESNSRRISQNFPWVESDKNVHDYKIPKNLREYQGKLLEKLFP